MFFTAFELRKDCGGFQTFHIYNPAAYSPDSGQPRRRNDFKQTLFSKPSMKTQHMSHWD